MNRFIVAEPSKCIGCRTCEVACVLAHAKTENVEVLATAGAAFHPRLKVLKTLTVSAPVMCHHCEDAPCVNACPSHAIAYRDDTVQVDQSKCLGCKTCVVACPFGAMEVITRPAVRSFAGLTVADGVKAEAHKCDLCTGHDGGPACVKVCPTDALHVMDADRLAATRAQRQLRSAVEAAATEAA